MDFQRFVDLYCDCSKESLKFVLRCFNDFYKRDEKAATMWINALCDLKIYHPEFYSAERLALECQYFIKSVNSYMELFNIIIVQKPDKKTIINTILELAKTSYFSYFTPYDQKMLEDRGFENWESFVQVYPSEKE